MERALAKRLTLMVTTAVLLGGCSPHFHPFDKKVFHKKYNLNEPDTPLHITVSPDFLTQTGNLGFARRARNRKIILVGYLIENVSKDTVNLPVLPPVVTDNSDIVLNPIALEEAWKKIKIPNAAYYIWWISFIPVPFEFLYGSTILLPVPIGPVTFPLNYAAGSRASRNFLKGLQEFQYMPMALGPGEKIAFATFFRLETATYQQYFVVTITTPTGEVLGAGRGFVGGSPPR